MTITKSVNSIGISRYAIPIFIALIAAGLAGNYFKFSILNADFIFGSIFAMLALQFFGFGRGVLAAAVIAGYTYLAWNHPYALITMTAEVAIVGWLIGRRKINLVIADAIYWLLIGIPLGFFCFHSISDFPVSNSLFLMTKQAVNGIANALVARLIFTGFIFRSIEARISFREMLSNLLIIFVLFPTVTLLILSARADLAETDRKIRTELIRDSQHITESLENWVDNRKSPVIHLAGMTTTLSLLQIQTHLEQTRLSDPNFLRIALLDSEAKIIAISPLIDEFGQSSIGKSFADRPFIPTLKQRLKPMLSEVVMARVGASKPMVTMLAPVVIREKFGGYVSGVLNFDRIETILQIHSSGRDIRYSLLDKNGNVVVTSRKDQKNMTPFSHSQGTLTRPDEDGIVQWIPPLPPNASTIDLWGKSFYVKESAIGDLAEWKLILEQPVAPFQKMLYNAYTGKFFMLFAILLVAQLLAEFFSRRILQPIDHLRRLTRDIPSKLVSTQQIIWPRSFTLETDHLIANFKEMADLLRDKFIDIARMNESLEKRIEAGTEELRKSEAFIRDIVENIPDMVFVKDAAYLRFVQFNRAGEEMLGYSRNELLGKNDHDLFPREQADFFTEKDREVLAGGKLVEIPEESIQTRNRGRRILHTKKIPLRDSDGTSRYLLGISEDITERKQREDALREANRKLQASQIATLNILEDLKKENEARKKNEAEIRRLNAELEKRVVERTAQLESAYKEIEAFSYSVSHDLKAPLRAISGFASIIARRHRQTLNDEARHYFDNIMTASDQMSALITDILKYSRIGRRTIDMKPVQLSQILTHVVDVLSLKIKEAGAAVSIPTDLPTVIGDAGLIRQVFTNLIENAVVFRKESIPLTVEIGYTEEDGLATIMVADNGIGIPGEFHEKIFTMFQRLHSEDQYPGTGIGLAIVKKAMNLMDGLIRVESEPGKGSTFIVTFRKE